MAEIGNGVLKMMKEAPAIAGNIENYGGGVFVWAEKRVGGAGVNAALPLPWKNRGDWNERLQISGAGG